MPEVEPEKNLELYKQCEVRRRSPPGLIDIGLDYLIEKLPGYYFDVVWIKADLVQKGRRIVDSKNNEWVIHEVYGSKPMARSRSSFKAAV